MDYPVSGKNPDIAGATVPHVISGGVAIPVSASAPLPVQQVEPVGSITWTKSTVTLDGSSDQVLAANTARKGLIIVNRVGNAQVDIDIAGGTVAAGTGIPLLAGDRLVFDGAATPLTKITAIGTNTQILNVWEGS
ncbi:MAG TPA: hypothetical protein VFB13_01970 [Reyranella sp.]|nr:hypothetical protein [Reyranella sp.]